MSRFCAVAGCTCIGLGTGFFIDLEVYEGRKGPLYCVVGAFVGTGIGLYDQYAILSEVEEHEDPENSGNTRTTIAGKDLNKMMTPTHAIVYGLVACSCIRLISNLVLGSLDKTLELVNNIIEEQRRMKSKKWFWNK